MRARRCQRWAIGMAAAMAAVSALGAREDDGSTVHKAGVPVTGDPVMANTGEYVLELPLFSLPGPLPLRYAITYQADKAPKSDYLTDGQYGCAVYHNVPYVFRSENALGVQNVSGWDEVDFARIGGVWTGAGNSSGDLQMYETGSTSDAGWYYFADGARGQVMAFAKPGGQPRWLMDRSGNRITFSTNSAGWVCGLSNGLGQGVALAFTNLPGGASVVASATDAAGRAYRFTYIVSNLWSSTNVAYLRRMVDPAGGTNTLNYSNCPYGGWPIQVVASRRLPNRTTPYRQQYGWHILDNRNPLTTPRVDRQEDAFGNAWLFFYASASNRVTVARPDGTTQRFDSVSLPPHVQWFDGGPVQRIDDPVGQTIHIDRDSAGRATAVADRDGGTTVVGYDGLSLRPIVVTNAAGGDTRFTYTNQWQTFTNVFGGEVVTCRFAVATGVTYANGESEAAEVDGCGRVIRWRDRASNTWTFAYNSRGQATRVTFPAGGWLDVDYDPATGLRTGRRFSDGLAGERYGYDAAGRRTAATNGVGGVRRFCYDRLDRLTNMVDETGRAWGFSYDAADNLLGIRDPTGGVESWQYDAMNRPTGRTDRAGFRHGAVYDAMGRPVLLRPAAGPPTTLAYSAAGHPANVAVGGRVWTAGYDAEGAMLWRRSPSGAELRWVRDPLGLVARIVDEVGGQTVLHRDAAGVVTDVADPAGQTTTYTFAGGRLAEVQRPSGASGAYAYDANGQLARVTDMNAQEWGVTHGATGRRTALSDPLSNTWTYVRNAAGWVTSVVQPDTSVLAMAYDAAGRMTNVAVAGTTLGVDYDAAGRVKSVPGVQLEYDPRGLVTGTVSRGVRCAAAFDGAGRLTRASYDGGAFTVHYGYSPVDGLLTGVWDSVTSARVAFEYDADGRLAVVRRGNGLTRSTTWDAAGRLTRLTDGPEIALLQSYDAAGRATQAVWTVPLPAGAALSTGGALGVYDKASQRVDAGFAWDRLGRLTNSPAGALAWDGLSRLVRAGGATLTYNGFGAVSTRVAGGTTNALIHHYALGGHPLAVVRDESSGSAVQYFVWSPDGGLLYMVDTAAGNAVRYYHGDARGAVLALSNAAGALTDRYAYTPFGRIVARQGATDQPFTFGGLYGLRQEGESTLYQARARYYDAGLGRFISREPLWPLIGDPCALNPYPFARNDPLQYTDASGRNANAIMFMGALFGPGHDPNDDQDVEDAEARMFQDYLSVREPTMVNALAFTLLFGVPPPGAGNLWIDRKAREEKRALDRAEYDLLAHKKGWNRAPDPWLAAVLDPNRRDTQPADPNGSPLRKAWGIPLPLADDLARAGLTRVDTQPAVLGLKDAVKLLLQAADDAMAECDEEGAESLVAAAMVIMFLGSTGM